MDGMLRPDNDPSPILPAMIRRGHSDQVVSSNEGEEREGAGAVRGDDGGAWEFNQRDGHAETVVHVAVTTGSIWRFVRLGRNLVAIDLPEYYFHQLGKILGILLAIAA
jgi:hypothetical protein